VNQASQQPAGRILVVDDEPSITDAVATALRYEGYEVDEASNGRDALAAVMRDEPDLVVLDWMLPDIPGIEVGRRMRGARVQDGDPVPHGEGRGRGQGRGAPRGR
jgi:two-component system OmpR family response regulator